MKPTSSDSSSASPTVEPPSYLIPFNKPFLAGREMEYLAQCVERRHTASGGTFTRRCESLLSESHSGAEVLLTTSCTDALEMTALLLDLRPGDEVVVPSFGFVSVANAFALQGASIRFADIDPLTLNLTPESVAKVCGPATRAIVAIHYGGLPCDLDGLAQLCLEQKISLIEDNAHGIFGRAGGQPLGTFGRFGTLSFHETKNISCGEGGALICNRQADGERAQILRDKGTNRRSFFKGEADRYTWVDKGSSFAPSDLLAAFLLAQLEERKWIASLRKQLWQRYDKELREWGGARGIQFPPIRAAEDSTHHVYFLLLPEKAIRDRMLRHLRDRGILAVFHYQALHSSPMGRKLAGGRDECPVAEDASGRLLRLPLFNAMTASEQQSVIAAVKEFSM